MDDYETLDDYFKDHPEDEAEFVEEMARLEAERMIDYPEDWAV